MKLVFAKQRYTKTRPASGEYKPFTRSHLRVTGQQSQVEQWEESDTQFTLQKYEVQCCLVGFCQGERPRGRGTWNIRPCHGSSAQLRVPPAACLRQRWRRFGGKVPLRSVTGKFTLETLMSLHSWKCVHDTDAKVAGSWAHHIHSEGSEKTFQPGRMHIIGSGARGSGCGFWTAPKIFLQDGPLVAVT